MKKYTKKHDSKTALESHIAKIKSRGGKHETTGMTIKYWFSDKVTDADIRKYAKEIDDGYTGSRINDLLNDGKHEYSIEDNILYFYKNYSDRSSVFSSRIDNKSFLYKKVH